MTDSMHHVRRGSGKPLLLIHGLGGSWRSWSTILDDLAARREVIEHPLVIGWGRSDRVCFPGQSERALELFPDAHLHWFEHCGHFPHWDAPQETARLILETTRADGVAARQHSLAA